MDLPSVAVVIPVFNGARYLGEALASVFAQTHRPAEVVVVDDGSTDGSAALAASFAGVTLLAQPNAGPSSARNAGVAASSAELIAFLDADDLWLRQKLERQVAALESDPAVGLVLCYQEYRFEGPSAPPRWFRGPTDGGSERGAVPSNWLLPRAVFERVGPFDASVRYAEDQEWFARALAAGVRRHYVEEALVVKRIHDANASGDVDLNLKSVLNVLRAKVVRERGSPDSGQYPHESTT